MHRHRVQPRADLIKNQTDVMTRVFVDGIRAKHDEFDGHERSILKKKREFASYHAPKTGKKPRTVDQIKLWQKLRVVFA